MEQTHDQIELNGFTVVGIEPDPDHPTWLYTIGLTEHDHPELSILGVPIELGYRVLEEMGRRIVDGDRLAYGESVLAGAVYLHVDDVDPGLWEATCSTSGGSTTPGSTNQRPNRQRSS